MELSRDVRAALDRFTLTPYEQKAYLALLRGGAMTARDISASGEVPYSKVYEVLGRLEAKGWVESSGGRPSRYHPRPPQIAARTSAMRIQTEIQEAERIVLDELTPLFEEKEVREKPNIWIIHGEFSVLTKLHELASRTTDELLIAVPGSVEGLLHALQPALASLRARAVKVKMMVTKREDRALDALTSAAEVRVRSQMFGGGVVSDGREALLLLGEERGRVATAIWADHPGLTQLAKDYFEYLWREAEPLP